MSGKSIISVSTAAPSSVASSSRSGASSRSGVGGLRVEMPFAAIEKRKDAVHFGIQVTTAQGHQWRLWHRYEEFQQLQRRLSNADWSDAEFPPKVQRCICRGQRQRTEDRRRGLETWLLRVLREAPRRDGWVNDLHMFLRVPPAKPALEIVAEAAEGPRSDGKQRLRACSEISE